MSDHNYVPSSKLGKWFNDRLPLLPAPQNMEIPKYEFVNSNIIKIG